MNKKETLKKNAIDKCKSFKIFKQLKKHGEEFAIHIIFDYIRALNKSLGLPEEEEILSISILNAISNIYFEGSFLIFLGTDGKEIMKIYAPL